MSDEQDIRGGLPSASSFYADVACAGRQNLLRALHEQNGATLAADDPEMTEFADRGTRIHVARSTGNTFNLAEDELDAYQKASALERQIVEDWMRDNDITVLSDPIVEERLWLNREDTMEPILSGQTDVVHLAGHHACVVDWKSGSAYYVGAANKNWQFRIYALLAWKEWPQLKRIRVALAMPEKFGAKTDYADFTEYDLRHIEQAVLHAVWLSQQPDAPMHAGPHCRFCPARAACHEAARYAMLPAVVTNGMGDLSPADINELVSCLPIEGALAVWQKRSIVGKIMDAIELRLKALPPEEHERLGLKLTEGKRLDKLKDVTSAFNALREAGWSSEELFKLMDLGKTKFVEAYIARTNCRKAEAEAFWNSQLDPFIERGRGKPSLVESV